MSSGTQRWTVTGGESGDDVTIVEGHLIAGSRYCDNFSTTRVLDLEAGTPRTAAPGCPAGAGQGWFATGNGASVSVYPLD